MSNKQITKGNYAMQVFWQIWNNHTHPMCKVISDAYNNGIAVKEVSRVLESLLPEQTITVKTPEKVRSEVRETPVKGIGKKKKEVKTLLARTFTYQGVKNVSVEVIHEMKVKSLSIFIHESIPQIPELITNRHNSKKNKKYSIREKETGELLFTTSSIKKGCNEIKHLVNFLNPNWKSRPIINKEGSEICQHMACIA